ncbi:MAG: DUF302 domain-containing protein [Bacteroidales bacterium]|nr:DUF302 domain-containing protein [Bacteroidales bacterium]
MEYYFSKTINASFDEAINRITEALKTEGFGIVSEIRMHERFKEKLDIDFKKYTILGACIPAYAYKALQVEDKIGSMFPCNVVVQEFSENHIEVAAVNPIASMMAIQNPALEGIAGEVTNKLQKVISHL